MQKQKNPCPTNPIRKNQENPIRKNQENPIRKTQERIWFFSVQSRFKDYVMEIFVPWNESNLVRLLSQIFSGRESVVKLFDFRILSTLLIRDIRIFILKGQAKRAVIVIALPLLFYFLNTRTFIDEREKSYNLINILPSVQDFVARARKKNVLLVPHLFMSLPQDKKRYQRCLLNPKEHFWLSSSNTNLNLQNFVLESEKQETISEESSLEKESNGIEWKIDSSFESIQNEYWEPEKEPENLYEWTESVFYRKKLLEELENKVEQLEKKLVEAEEEFALSSQPEEIIIKQRKKKVQDIENAKELFRKVTKLFEEILEETKQEKMFQEESDQAKEYFSFSEPEFFQGLFDHLSMEEPDISINSINKPSEKLKLLKGRQDAFQYFKKLEKNRIVDLWKVKTFLKNPSVNYDISDPVWNIRQDINQFNCIRFINKNLSSISSSSCDQNKEQLALNDDFQLKKFVFKKTNQFTLSITNPNQSYSNDEIDLDMDYCMNELHSLNQTLLNSFNYFFNKRNELHSINQTLLNSFNYFFNKRNELTHDSFLRGLNIFEKKKTSKDDETEQLIFEDDETDETEQLIFEDDETDETEQLIFEDDETDETEQLILNKYKIKTNEHVEKAFKIFNLLKNVFVSRSNEYVKYLSDFVNEYFKYLSDFVNEYVKYLSDFVNEYVKYLSDFVLNDLESFQKEWKKVLKRSYIEFLKTFNRYSFQSTKTFHALNKYYMEFHKTFHEYSVELQKVLNKNKYYLEFIFLIKTLSRTLNNVIQDAITQHSSSWIICQKEWFNHSIFRTVKKKNLNLNAFVLSIQIEYFQKRLEYFLSISNNIKNTVELQTTRPNLINNNQIKSIIRIHIFPPDEQNALKSKSIPNLESSKTIAPLVLNEKKSIIQFIIDAFDNGKNDMELLNNTDFSTCLSTIFDDQDNWLNPFKLSNQNSLRTSFYKANTFEFLDYLHCPRFFYKKRLSSYMERIHIKNKNVAYGQLLNLVPIYNNLFSLSIGEMRAVYSEKKTISLIKSKVNILLDKYLRDQVLIRDLDKSSNLVNKLNSIFQRNFDFFIEDIYKTSLINPQILPQIVNFDKNSCYPFLSSSDSEEKIFNQDSQNSFNCDIDLIQTQSYQEDLLSEISIRMNQFSEKEEYSPTESFKHIIEDKAIGDFIEVKAIGDFFNKEKLKFFFSKLKFFSFKTVQIKINIFFEKWGLFQIYRSWLWLLTSAGWKYTKNMFLATFPEIPINSSDQLLSIPQNIDFDDIGLECRQNWNHNLNILRSLYHQFWALLKWEIQNKIDQIFREKILPILNEKILPILNDEILPLLNLMLSRWNITHLLKITNELVLEIQLEGKPPISFDGWKYIKNIREYDLFLCIFIGFLFYFCCGIFLFLIQFCRNVHLIQVLQNKNCFEGVGEMIQFFRILRNKYTNLSWYGFWLTFVDFLEMESDPDDIGLRLLLKIWYEKKIKWFLVPRFLHIVSIKKGRKKRNECWKYYSLVQKILYECEVDYFFLREKRLFLIQEKILQFESKLTPPIGFFHEFEKREQPGLLYFRYLAEFIQRGLTHRIGLMNSELNSSFLAEMPIFAAFYQKMTSVPIRSFLDDHVRFYSLYPVPSFSNRILLIGPKETGRSYLAKSLAADSYLPFIRISPKSFFRRQKLLSRDEAEYTSSAKQSYLEHENILRSLGWSGRPKDIYENEHYDFKPHHFLDDRVANSNPPEYFSRRVIQFVFTLKLAKLMSPCVIWIPSIHELNDYFFVIALLIELLGDSYNPLDDEKETTIKQNIVVIASTDIPKKIDPLLITPPRSKRRFDTFINTKKLPAPYREKEFPLLLRNKGLYLKKEWNCYDEFGLTTKGFTMHDLAKLADEIFLVSMIQNTSTIDNDIIENTLYRSNWGPCNYNLKLSEFIQGLPYKIGKAIIQNKLTYLKNSIGLSLDFQGRRANYLHQWYLEPSIGGTAAKEFTVFYHILGCLAGSVAQDCFFLSENKENWSRPFDPFIENDFILASSLLQGILEEFPSLAIYQGNSDYITIAPQFKKDTMQKGLSSMLDKIVLSKELRNSCGEEDKTPIVCDSRTWRFSFIRSNRFEHIKDITIENPLLDYLHLFGSFQERPTRLSSLYWKKFLMSGSNFRPSLYGKKDDIVERQTAAFWEAKLLYKKFQRLGIYQFDTEEYAVEYKPLNTPVICIAQRFLWDPVSIRFFNKHFSFEQIALFDSKELVKSIYLTYSSTREHFSIKKTLKAIRKRKKVRKIALGIKIQTNDDDLPLNSKIKQKDSFEDFKRFQEIGIRLRRVLPYSQSVISECWFREKTRDDKLKQRLLKGERENIDLLSNESLIYKTLFESYEYLSNLFFSNRMLFKQMSDTLLKTKWLSPNAIDCLLAEGLNKKPS